MTDDEFEQANETGPTETVSATPPTDVTAEIPAPVVPPAAAPYGYFPPPMPPAPTPSGSSMFGGPPPPGPGYQGAPPAGRPYWSLPVVPPTPPARGHGLRNAALVTGAAIIALGAGIGIGHSAWTKVTSPASSTPATHGFTPQNGSGSSGSSQTVGPSDVSAIAKKVDPGLVDIDTSLAYQQEEAAGTGIVLTPNGEILTNNHVIDGATTISVTDIGNGKTYSASVVGYDRTQDIAVLQLHGASGLKTATIGDSSNNAVGEDVVGIGNAGGTGGTPSAAGGTITALGQAITASDEGDGSSEQLTDLIQTNADIQAGDSGGSLVNASGKVVGIDTAASDGFTFESEGDSEGNQGYAIPINNAIAIAKEIEGGSTASAVHIGATGFLGVLVQTVSRFGSSGLGNSSSPGATVAEVVTSSPAQEAGLAQGDVITSVNGKTVTTPESLTGFIAPFHPGDKVTIGWTDSTGVGHTATVTLTSGPPQ